MTTSDTVACDDCAEWARGLNNAELWRALDHLQKVSNSGSITEAQQCVLAAVRTEYTNRHDQGAI